MIVALTIAAAWAAVALLVAGLCWAAKRGDDVEVFDDSCPSCGGTGWAVIRADGITWGHGPCRCIGGHTWNAAHARRLDA